MVAKVSKSKNNQLETDQAQVVLATLKSMINFQSEIESLSKEDFALLASLHLKNIKVQHEWLPDILSHRFGGEFSKSKINTLIKSSEMPVSSKSKFPLYFRIYMLKFWNECLLKLKADWSVNDDRFALFIVQYQQESRYLKNWSIYTIKLMLGDKYNDKEIKELIEAAEIDNLAPKQGSIKSPIQCKQLLQINLAIFLTKKTIHSNLKDNLFDEFMLFHDRPMQSAIKKLKKAYDEISAENYKPLNIGVDLTSNELLALSAKSNYEFALTKMDDLLSSLNHDDYDGIMRSIRQQYESIISV